MLICIAMRRHYATLHMYLQLNIMNKCVLTAESVIFGDMHVCQQLVIAPSPQVKCLFALRNILKFAPFKINEN